MEEVSKPSFLFTPTGAGRPGQGGSLLARSPAPPLSCFILGRVRLKACVPHGLLMPVPCSLLCSGAGGSSSGCTQNEALPRSGFPMAPTGQTAMILRPQPAKTGPDLWNPRQALQVLVGPSLSDVPEVPPGILGEKRCPSTVTHLKSSQDKKSKSTRVGSESKLGLRPNSLSPLRSLLVPWKHCTSTMMSRP